MSDTHDAASSGFGVARFALRLEDANIEVEAKLPEGQAPPAVLLPVLRNLSNTLSELTVQRAGRAGKSFSCHEGCGACCRQAVPITAVEARAIADWLSAQPEERQAVLRARFQQAAAKLEESGIAGELRTAVSKKDRDAIHNLGLRYFALGIPCPFLEQERCTIHEIRPLRCREYLVVSPPAYCAQPGIGEIDKIEPPVMLSQILARWDVNGDPQPRELILLALLDEWLAQHPADQDQVHRTPAELLEEFIHAFARDASARSH
jgi:Fe-S-cluster containining protein